MDHLYATQSCFVLFQTANYGSGIVVCGGLPHIQGNQIYSNREYGIVYMQSGRVIIEIVEVNW